MEWQQHKNNFLSLYADLQAAMEKVISSQLHAKKLLEKQLSEIEARQRQSEVRRMKQIRDLGVDLSKIQATSRDLDEVIYGEYCVHSY